MTSYTSFKSIIPETYQITKTNSGKSPSFEDDLDDKHFIISNESIHI